MTNFSYGGVWSAEWLPDSRRLVISRSYDRLNAWVMPLAGDRPARQVTALRGNVVTHAALSPDGTRLVYASVETGNAELWSSRLDGSDLRQLTHTPAQDFWPTWSPDGRWIAYTSKGRLWKVPAAGGSAIQVNDDASFRPDWSPVDNRIAYNVQLTGILRIADADTGKTLLVSRPGSLVSIEVGEAPGPQGARSENTECF